MRLLACLIVLGNLLLGCKKTSDLPPANEIPSLVYLVYGKVHILNGENEIIVPIPGETKLYSHHTIVSGKNSGIDILTHDEIFIRVYSDTKVRIASLMSSKGSSVDSRLYLNSGRVFTIAKKLLKTRSIAIETPSVVAGVRGTEFMVIHKDSDPSDSSPIPAKVMVLDGSVEVELIASGQKYIVEEGKKLDPTKKTLIADLTKDEKEELQRESSSITFLVEERKNEIRSIIERFEQEKSSILLEIEEKKAQDKKILEDQKIHNEKLLQNQKENNTESIQNIQRNLEDKKSKIQNKSREEIDSIKSSSQSEIERIRKGSQQ